MTRTYDVVSVEDNDTVFALLEAVLEELPIALRRASTGAEAIAMLTQAKPDLVLLDITLPDMRGWDVLDRLSADGKLEGVPVLVLTSHTETAHRVIGRMQDVTAYMTKPFLPSELLDKIGQLLGLA
ncbi:MAG: response regulator transcription factor [Chloroflexi bacterium]|nr:response regulator transcription factor [Chloroflexota bacterium]MBI3764658.1 response regulator transcription factor [Chloroflexota bacterium]